MSVQANGKKRLILDLRYVNKFLHKMHVKYEDWKTAISYFAGGAYMFSFDLKSGYHHVEIFEGHQTYVSFSWKHSVFSLVKFCVFTVLPFGLSAAARGTIEIVDRRVVRITNTIVSIIASDFVLSVRRLTSFTGQIISTAPVSGNINRIMTRHCIMSTLRGNVH